MRACVLATAAGAEAEESLSESTASLGRSSAGTSMRVDSSISNCVLLGKTTLTSLRAKSGSLEQVQAVFPQACSVGGGC